jgi:hypothetical protein
MSFSSDEELNVATTKKRKQLPDVKQHFKQNENEPEKYCCNFCSKVKALKNV